VSEETEAAGLRDAPGDVSRGEPPPGLGLSLVALFCVAALALATPYVEIVIRGTQVGSVAPPPMAVVLLVLLALIVAPLARRIRGRVVGWATPGGLAVIYAVLLITAVLPSCQFAGWVVPVATGPYLYATPANKWEQLMRFMPRWWRPPFSQQVADFYHGLPEGAAVPYTTWVGHFLAWASLILALYLTLGCLFLLFARQWVDHERLPFPLVQLPLELMREAGRPLAPGSILRERLLWLGAAAPVAVHSMNALHRHLPAVPELRLAYIPLGEYFTRIPLSAVNPWYLCVYFALIGFAYLGAGDVIFSMWFFFILYKVECVLGATLGYPSAGDQVGLRERAFPLIVSQHVGSWLTLIALGAWAARHHLGNVWRSAISGAGADAGMYRGALLGLLLGWTGLTVWTVKSGMSLALALGYWPITMAFLLAAHRLMAEGGVNFLWAAQSGPNYLIYALAGAKYLSVRSWLVLLCLPYFTWIFKGPVGPQVLEGFKVLSDTGTPSRRLLWPALLGVLVAVTLGYWWTIRLVYTQGGGQALDNYRFVHVGERPFAELTSVISEPEGPSAVRLTMVGASVLFTILLGMLRWRFAWWRLHPLGYAASTMWSMNFMWFSLLLGSAASALIRRYGGLSAYRKGRPFFLGMILGDFLMVGLISLLDGLTGRRGYFLFGN